MAVSNQIIWSCWLQGREHAPWLVEKCLASWEQRNPGWELRCLDQHSLPRYVDFPDLGGKRITRTSFSDIARILLLNEFGGVWVDATTFCNMPLARWLDARSASGFFAFDRPGDDRRLSSWFLASERYHYLVDRWCAGTLAYWSGRARADSYFWFHNIFRDLCESDPEFRRLWDDVPKLSADGPHSIQRAGMFAPERQVAANAVDWDSPVFKLTYRFEESGYTPGTLLWKLLESPHSPTALPESHPAAAIPAPQPPAEKADAPATFACLKVSTNNLGDHIQILAALRLLRRLGVEPALYIDRDDEIASCEMLREDGKRAAILLNGWFKTNREQWPPNERLEPVFLGFHIRLFQCPELLSDEALRYYRKHEPIGCRDAYTRQLLESRGVRSFESNCLTLSLPGRRNAEVRPEKVIVASRDRRLLEFVPQELGPCTYVNHYSDTRDFAVNLQRAAELLELYRTQAKLVVTTFLHAALPAIAMGIPVVVFYPGNDAGGHQSDVERFTAIEGLVPIHPFGKPDGVDWCPQPIDASRIKLSLVEQFFALAARWRLPQAPCDWSFAPSAELPPPN